jgi:hypothetical protein
MPTVPFVVLFLERSGSSYLVDALGRHPDVEAAGEIFVDTPWQAKAIHRYLTAPVPAHARGFKLKAIDVEDPVDFGAVLSDVGARVLCLSRRNRVKQAISRCNAIRLHDRTGEWNLWQATPSLTEPLVVPLPDFERELRRITEHHDHLLQLVAGLELPTLSLQYEDLLLREDSTFELAFRFLGVDPLPVTGETRKNTPDDLRSAVANFDDLRAAYAGTSFEAMFDEVLVPGPVAPGT